MKIRNATEKDLKEINQIYNYYILNSNFNLAHAPITMADREEWFQKHKGKYPVIVAEINGVIAGFAALSKFRTAEGYDITAEVTIYLKENFKGVGIGVQLMEELTKQAEKFQIEVLISIITHKNQESITFHKKCGFQETAFLPNLARKNGELFSVVYMTKFIKEMLPKE